MPDIIHASGVADPFAHIYQQTNAMRAFHTRRKKFKARLRAKYAKSK